MNENSIDTLIEAIGSVNAQEFWWDSPLLSQAAATHDARIVRALSYRHHCLGNKEAFSAHVLRHAIRLCDGTDLRTLWSIIDAETDQDAIEERMEDMSHLPWAAAFILGEIGGAPAFHQTVLRLVPLHSARHFLIVRLFSHILVRYLSIGSEDEPQATMIDLETGEKERLLSRYVSRPNFEMTRRKRLEANELFTPLPQAILDEAYSNLSLVPDRYLNMPREQFRVALSRLPIVKR